MDVTDNEAAGRFEIEVDGEVAGFAEYRLRDGAMSLTHTVVEPAYEGRGVGSALVEGALDAARERGLAVLPYCPFVRDYVEKHPEYADLVPDDRRAEFGLATS